MYSSLSERFEGYSVLFGIDKMSNESLIARSRIISWLTNICNKFGKSMLCSKVHENYKPSHFLLVYFIEKHFDTCDSSLLKIMQSQDTKTEPNCTCLKLLVLRRCAVRILIWHVGLRLNTWHRIWECIAQLTWQSLLYRHHIFGKEPYVVSW